MRKHLRSERVKLPRVHRVCRAGSVHKYHRKTRVKLPCDVPEDHPRFIEAWTTEEAKKGRQRTRGATGSVEASCIAYLGSTDFHGLSKGYSPVIRRHVEKIREQGGNAPVSALLAKHVRQDLEPLTPAVASSRLKAWRKVAAFWLAKGWIEEDFTTGIKRKPIPKTQGHKEWTHEDVEAFRACWPIGTAQRTALEVFQYTGARCCDARNLNRGMVDRDGLLRFVQDKTENPVMVPWACYAGDHETERQHVHEALGPDFTYIITQHGKLRSAKSLSGWFSEAATIAGMPKLSAHGLRKYRMNRLAEAGASVLKMQAWVGHVTLDEVQEYILRADRRRAILGPEQEQNTVNGAI